SGATASTAPPPRTPISRTRRARTRTAADQVRRRWRAVAADARCKRPWRYSNAVIKPRGDSGSIAERALGRGYLVASARIDGDRRPQRPRQTFEARFGNMMVVAAIERGDVQRHRGIHGEGLEPFLHQLGVECSHFVAHEFDVEHQERPAGNVDRDPG